MDGIGVVGGGLAALHLGLFLQKHSIPATIYAERTPDQVRRGCLLNTAAHWANTRARERELEVDFWANMHAPTECFYFYVALPQPLWIRGMHEEPGICVDQRVMLPRLLEEFESRGGKVVYGQVPPDNLEWLSEQHEFVVVSSGRGSLAELFPRLPEHSPYTKPQRLICTGLYEGIRYLNPVGVIFGVSPGHGELFVMPYYTLDGPIATLFFEIVPGGQLEYLMQAHYADDPTQFESMILQALREHFPMLLDFIDISHFKLHGPLDVLQGAITPTVRRPYAKLNNGRCVMAIGDLHVVNDPLLGQGANAASHAAFVMGRSILHDGLAFDEHFCRRTEARLWDYLSDVTEWNNYFMQVPMPLNVTQYLMVASEVQPIADYFATNFAHPYRNWNVFATQERTEAFFRRHSAEPPGVHDSRLH